MTPWWWNAIIGAVGLLIPLILWWLSNRRERRTGADADKSAVKIALIQDGAAERSNYLKWVDEERARTEAERAKTEQWREKYYNLQTEIAASREAASTAVMQNLARITELAERVKELERQQADCRCKKESQ